MENLPKCGMVTWPIFSLCIYGMEGVWLHIQAYVKGRGQWQGSSSTSLHTYHHHHCYCLLVVLIQHPSLNLQRMPWENQLSSKSLGYVYFCPISLGKPMCAVKHSRFSLFFFSFWWLLFNTNFRDWNSGLNSLAESALCRR